jgi:DNA-binding NtrC family response regulator
MANILLVEDEEELRALAQSMLDQLGHDTTAAANVEEALSLLASDQKFDLLFTDIGLGANLQAGIELATKARERRPTLRVIYTTGQGITDGMEAMFVNGFHFVPKPYTIKGLTIAVDDALREQG